AWSLALAPPEEPAWFKQVAQLAVSNKKDKKEEARQRLKQLQKTASPKEQGLVLRTLALLAGNDGASAQAAAFLQKGIEADRAENNLSGEIEKETLLARLYLNQGHFSDAQQILNRLGLPPNSPALSKYQSFYYQGLLADAIGDYRSVLRH